MSEECGNLLSTEGMNSLIGRSLSSTAGHKRACDVEEWMIYIGAALGLVPKGLRDWKALIYESVGVSAALFDIFQRLVALRVLVLEENVDGERLYRLPEPCERLVVSLPDSYERLCLAEDLHVSSDTGGLVYLYEGNDGVRRSVTASSVYPECS